MKNIIYISDFGIIGSGYRNLSIPICEEISKENNLFVLGFEYRGQEHNFDFPLIPISDFNVLRGTIINLLVDKKIDIIIVSLDIPMQKIILDILEDIYTNNPHLGRPKFFGVFPIESDPVNMTTAYHLSRMDERFVITQFGVDELKKQFIESNYLPVSVDTGSWKIPSAEEKKMLRDSFAIDEDEFVILTVADNQERKFLSRTAQIISEFRKRVYEKVRWVVVTRQRYPAGWNLDDLCSTLGLSDVYMPFEKGMPFKELWAKYAMSDVFLLTSKAEGLGMPVLESFSVGVPVVGTDCSGIRESVLKGGGYLIDVEDTRYAWIDPFENQRRYFADVDSGVEQLKNVYLGTGVKEQTTKARGYVETLTDKAMTRVIVEKIKNG